MPPLFLSLPETLKSAEVAPVGIVGAEGDDLFALGGEAQIRSDDGEDAFFGDHRQQARGDDVDAGERQRLRLRRGPDDFVGLAAAGAAAAEHSLLVEEQVARRLAVLHHERGQSALRGVELGHAPQVDVADDVDVVQDERLVFSGRILQKEPAAFFNPPPVSSSTSSREISIRMPKFWFCFR